MYKISFLKRVKGKVNSKHGAEEAEYFRQIRIQTKKIALKKNVKNEGFFWA